MPVAAAAFFATRLSFDPVFRSSLFADFLTLFDKDSDFMRFFMHCSHPLGLFSLAYSSVRWKRRMRAEVSSCRFALPHTEDPDTGGRCQGLYSPNGVLGVWGAGPHPVALTTPQCSPRSVVGGNLWVLSSCRSGSLRGAILSRPRTLPGRIHPAVAAHKAPRPPSGALWLHEIKHDSFRVIARQGRRAGGNDRLSERRDQG